MNPFATVQPRGKYCAELLMAVWAFVMPVVLFSQDVMRFKNGREVEAQIIWQTKDSLVFESLYPPGFRDKISLSEIDTIYPLSGPRPEESIEIIQRKYKSGQRTMNIGLGILAGGAAITLGAGIYALTGGVNESLGGGNNPGGVPTIIGAAICVAGIIVTTAGAVSKNKYEKKLEEISLDFHFNPKFTGVTLRLNF